MNKNNLSNRIVSRLSLTPVHKIPGFVFTYIRRNLWNLWERHIYSNLPGWLRIPRGINISFPNLLHWEVFDAQFPDYFKEIFFEDTRVILEEADKYLSLKFNLLGSGWIESQKLPWHVDIKSGASWDPKIYFSDVTYGLTPGVDVKVPWELSRGLHLVRLGQAYILTHNEKYAVAVVNHIKDWIQNNRVRRGVNWSCPMDIALRACNWLVALELIQKSSSLQQSDLKAIGGSLWEHGHHIRHHLEWGGGVTSNHYLSDLLGLYYIGKSLNQSEWTTFSQNELEKELLVQTYDDGFDYEGSTAYHRLVSEIYFYFSILSSPGTPILKERLIKMFKVIQQLAHPDGNISLIGDNDSGRIHSFFTREDKDMRYLLNFGSLHFNRPELAVQEWGKTSEILWLFGKTGWDRLQMGGGISVSQLPSKFSGESGLISLRKQNSALIFSAQPNGTKGIGNHTHNDKLSFTLHVEGDDFFIDPGTIVYTPDPAMRNRLRSTRSHNTVMIDGIEQNTIDENSLFTLGNEAKTMIDKSLPQTLIDAHHTGYLRLSDPVTHRRSISTKLGEDVWEITDQFEGNKEHALEWNFILGPSIRPEIVNKHLIRLVGPHGSIEMQLSIDWITVEIVDGIFGPQYGVAKPTKAIKLSQTAKLPIKTVVNLSWKRN